MISALNRLDQLENVSELHNDGLVSLKLDILRLKDEIRVLRQSNPNNINATTAQRNNELNGINDITEDDNDDDENDSRNDVNESDDGNNETEGDSDDNDSDSEADDNVFNDENPSNEGENRGEIKTPNRQMQDRTESPQQPSGQRRNDEPQNNRNRTRRHPTLQAPRIEGTRWDQERRISVDLSQGATHITNANEDIRGPDNSHEDDGFTPVRSRRRRRIIGNSTTPVNGLQGAPAPRRSIFVSRIMHGNEDSLRKFLNDRNITVIDMEKKSNENARFKSYKINVSVTDYYTVKSSAFWPKGIMCQTWRERRFSNNIDYTCDY